MLRSSTKAKKKHCPLYHSSNLLRPSTLVECAQSSRLSVCLSMATCILLSRWERLLYRSPHAREHLRNREIRHWTPSGSERL